MGCEDEDSNQSQGGWGGWSIESRAQACPGVRMGPGQGAWDYTEDQHKDKGTERTEGGAVML